MDWKYRSQSGKMEFCEAMLEVRKCVWWSLVRVCEPNVLLSHDTTKRGITPFSLFSYNLIQVFYLINNVLKMESHFLI